MLGISGNELLIIGVFAFILLGPEKLPEAVRTIMSFWRQFNETRESVEASVRAELFEQSTESNDEDTDDLLAGLPKSPQAIVHEDLDDEEGEEE